jgi:glycerol-3-phosphate dehydrogenase
VHVFLEKRLSNFAIIAEAKDGRQVFLLPWQNMSVLGTTDDDYYGDLDDVIATTEEARYLCEAIARVVPAVRTARAIGTWGGVRPTLYEWGMHEDALSRDHRIVDHAQHGAPGFFSMLGGKLASYRLFAEEMSDVVALRLSKREKCQTHSLPLPGGEEHVSREQMEFLAQEFLIDELSVRRLVARHGSEARSILESSYETPEQRRIVCACEPVTEVEIRHTLRHEWARSVEDVSRRTRLGLGQCGGMRCALECGRIVAEERDQSPAEGLESAARFLRQGLRKRLSVMGPEQARQEALSAAHIYAQSGILLGEER